jgi:formylglycine-generating enzyme required for sulfatase activity
MDMSEPVRVFVSYASQDRTFAQKLVTSLQASGAEVWWDVSGIDEGDFLGKINQALQQCQWLVLVLTPNAVASKWVNIEVNAAINRREQGLMQGVLPVLATPVQAGMVPPVWDNLHRYDAVKNYQGEVGRLLIKLGLSPAPVQQLVHHAPVQPAPSAHVAPPDRFPLLLASLGYQMAFLDGVEVILPPLCDVPAGPFLMGSDRGKDKQAEDREQPQHWVTLGTYQMAKHPVTVAEYACFVRGKGRSAPNGGLLRTTVSWQTQLRKRLDHPVVMVTWHDAAAYATRLSERTSEIWRLPTEAEWEKAARWDEAMRVSRRYPWGDAFDAARCNVLGSFKFSTTPVGNYPNGASPCGAQDRTGNVIELTSSVREPYPYSATDGRENADTEHAKMVSRGGSWTTVAEVGRAAFRSFRYPNDAQNYLGFRLARSVPNS